MTSSLTPIEPPTPDTLTPLDDDETREITYGDEPLLDGSVTYGELIGEDGFLELADEPEVGTFTPAS